MPNDEPAFQTSLMAWLYSALLYLLLPLMLIRLQWRGIKSPAYRQRWQERLAWYRPRTATTTAIWFHAVSVGEAEALFPLVRQLQARYPKLSLLVTCTTPTGSARIQSVLGNSMMHVYLPYDTPDAVQRFIKHFNPQLAVIVETEIWPNLFNACVRHSVPVYIINARLSEKSARGYQKLSALIKPALRPISGIAAQSDEDAQRYVSIGVPVERVQNTGNIKFDMDIASELVAQGQQLKSLLFTGRFVWLCASTHADEELVLLKIYQTLKATIPELLIVLVPRHPERFAAVNKIAGQLGLNTVLRTSNIPCTAATDVYLADTMGELKILYGACDVAFVGGSLVPKGGHNILEPAAIGVPVLFGPFMNNFKDIAKGILQAEAAIQCQNPDQLTAAITELYTAPEQRKLMVEHGKQFLQRNRGALERICQMLDQGMPLP